METIGGIGGLVMLVCGAVLVGLALLGIGRLAWRGYIWLVKFGLRGR